MRIIALQSTNVASLAYDLDEQVCIVQFQSGDVYRYVGVPGNVILSVLFDPVSQGKAFDAKIRRGNYPFEKITDLTEIEVHV